MTFMEMIVMVSLVAAGAFALWLSVTMSRLSLTSPRPAQSRISTGEVVRGAFTIVLLLLGLLLLVSIFRQLATSLSDKSASEPSQMLVIDERTHRALEDAVSRRFLDAESLEALEQWLNSNVRTDPAISKARTVTVAADSPKRVIGKIAEGQPLTDTDRLQLLDWLAFEVAVGVEPMVQGWLRTVLMGGKLHRDEQELLSLWLKGAPVLPRYGLRQEQTEIRFKRVPGREREPAPAAPSEAAPQAPTAEPSAAIIAGELLVSD